MGDGGAEHDGRFHGKGKEERVVWEEQTLLTGRALSSARQTAWRASPL